MRSFAAILLLIAVCLIAAAVVAYPFWLLVGLIDDQPIHRVLHRIAMLFGLISLIWLARRWRVADRTSAGFGLPKREFWKQIGIGIVAGTLIILPPLIALQVLGVRIDDERVQMTLLQGAYAVTKGLATGLVVALIEETFFRGALFTAIERESGPALAVLLPSLLYASVHFLGGRLRVPADQIDWASGFAVLERMFIAYGNPAAIVDSFAALFAVGVLLALVRLRTGNIAACIGMHAAWVCALYCYGAATEFNPDSDASWLAGSYNEVIGWGTVMWMGVLAVIHVIVNRSMRTALAIR